MSSEHPDLYGVLGVSRTASPAQISHAYRILLHTHHPDSRDADADAEAERNHDLALRQVLAAYAVLHDPQRRADYDRRPRSSAAAQFPGIPLRRHHRSSSSATSPRSGRPGPNGLRPSILHRSHLHR